jgi:hypothetical protein
MTTDMDNFERFAANFRRERAAEKRQILGFPPVLAQTGDHTWTEVHNLYTGELVSARPGEPVDPVEVESAAMDEALAEFELDRAEDAHFDARMGW